MAETGRRPRPTLCGVKPISKSATYADLLALPEDIRAEIIGGEVTTTPSPLPEHSKVQGALRSFIGGPFDDDDGRDGPGGWWIFAELDVQLGPHDVVRPDLAGWRRPRLPEPWGIRPITVIPDWVCEVISPSNAAHDRVTKAKLYANHGVGHFWLVDPVPRVLEAFKLTDRLWLRVGCYDDQATVRIPPFEEVEIELGRLFPPPPAR